MSITSVATLIDDLRQNQLLERAQLDELTRTLQARFVEPQALGKELVKRGWLTPYQLDQVLRGRTADLLRGSYVLLERLGEGDTGEVFKACQRRVGRVVALKVVRKEKLPCPEAGRRFDREVQAAARLKHPNMVFAYDVEEVGDTHLFATEYVEGTDLARLVRQSGPLPVALACDCVRQAALGLEHAHQRGIVHRNVKPSNLILTAGGTTVKVLDLGLARLGWPLGEEGSNTLNTDRPVIGTPDYLAPEQALDPHAVDGRADLYSLGCTLYHLLTGRPPFPTGSLTEKLLKHLSEDPPPVQTLRPDVPLAVAAVVARLLAKRPTDRFQTAAELVASLARATAPGDSPTGPPPADAVPVALPPPAPQDPSPELAFASLSGASGREVLPPGRRTRRPARQRRWLLIAGAGAAVLLGTVVALVVGPSPEAPVPTGGKPPVVKEGSGRGAPSAPRIVNSLGMELVFVPAGGFWMGSPESEWERRAEEGPRHQVMITKPFYIGAHPTTVGNFRAFVKATGYQTEAEKGGGAIRWDPVTRRGEQDQRCTWKAPGWHAEGNQPVVCVTWPDATAFCAWLSRQERREYRLPTESEREYACRAGTKTTFSFGDDIKQLGRYAWYAENAGGRAHAVGRLMSNAWDLYDMQGNVWEWCSDFYDPGYYQAGPVRDPQGPSGGVRRSVRGGSWNFPGWCCRSANRDSYPANEAGSHVGFRVVLSVPAQRP
jgi:formylglycine-generating enzyme required for sulfatase activity